MGSKVNLWITISILAVFVLSTSAAPTSSDSHFLTSLNSFSHNVFSELFKSKGDESIIYSPFSIQSCLAMVRMGADGQTATEMDQGLSFTGQSADSLADNYHSMLAKYEKNDILKIANKLYVEQGYVLQDKYNEVLSKKFLSPAENIDFGLNVEAADLMNTWVESKTNNLIKHLIDPSMLSIDTRLVLLSAIHFKGKWKQPFDPEHTRVEDFYTDETNSIKVEMMFQTTNGFGFFDELDATAVRLPYENSDLSMMIILPKSRTGLAALAEKLKTVPLKTLTSQMSGFKVDIRMPKFKAEFEIEMTDILKKMGMNLMFGDTADFSKMLKSSEHLKVSSVIHKAFIDVSEEGTEAAATTGAVLQTVSMPMTFTADHPFYYVIMNEDSVPLFQGTYNGV